MIKVQISHNGKVWNFAEAVAGDADNIKHYMLAIKSAQKQANEILTSIVQQENEIDITEEEDASPEEDDDEDDDALNIECVVGPHKKKIKIE